MKFLALVIFMTFVSVVTASEVCDKAWKGKEKTCSVSWTDSQHGKVGLEYAYFKKNCKVHEGGKTIDCIQVRDCRKKNSLHVQYIYFQKNKLDFLCDEGKETVLYGDQKDHLEGAVMLLKCENNFPKEVKLIAPGGKEKKCDFKMDLSVAPTPKI